MERMRTTLLVLLVLGLASMTVFAAVAPGTAATGAQAPAIAAAGETPCSTCSSTLKCPCGCSPLAGAWVAKLFPESSKSSASMEEALIQTFKFAPINEGCSKFVVNSQSVTRPEKVAKFWPNACDQTEFVGVACEDDWKDIKLTAISYGVQRCASDLLVGRDAAAPADIIVTTPTCPRPTKDKIQFIAVMTAKIEMPESCLQCGPDQKSPNTDGKSATPDGAYTGECKEPKELAAKVYIAFFDAAQDADHDGFPDCTCDEAVLCLKFEACLRRVEQMVPCDAETKSLVACLAAFDKVTTTATGKAFIKEDPGENDVDVVVTVNDIKDVKKAALQINGQDVLVVFSGSKNGTFTGLLVCGEFTAKELVGPLQGKKIEELFKALDEGKVTVVVSTNTNPNGEISGKAEDP